MKLKDSKGCTRPGSLASAPAVELLHGIADVAGDCLGCDRGVLEYDAEVVIGTCAQLQAVTQTSPD